MIMNSFLGQVYNAGKNEAYEKAAMAVDKRLAKCKKVVISDELFELVYERELRQNYPLQWNHLQSALQFGTISPMEGYECIELGYVPAYLKVRDSKYSHLFVAI